MESQIPVQTIIDKLVAQISQQAFRIATLEALTDQQGLDLARFAGPDGSAATKSVFSTAEPKVADSVASAASEA